MKTKTVRKAMRTVLFSAIMLTAPLAANTDVLGDWIERFGGDKPPVVAKYDREAHCLARVIYHEARGEHEAGKLAVARVALNRVDHKEFPSTVCRVIAQQNAFPWVKAHTPTHGPAFAEAKRLALQIMTWRANDIKWGPTKAQNALFFNTVPFGYKRLKYSGKIGGHLFYDLKE